MRAAVLRDGRMVYRDDVPEPVPGPGQVLVAVRSCGICGSDLHFAAHGEEMLSLSKQMGAGVGLTFTATSLWATNSARRCSKPDPKPTRIHREPW
ncbi:alcohol dehydrogenase GroES-like domain protein [Mycobacterium xenopi 4042]|uniref:Alcohol dehydrogenase GroES-like domain protein n=1 Tax=Mycobacterium xenopi 4042 TaxID=1299334 RepID=X7ZUU2_MYCXE|nr:alcohol dehydrogenase GroES-like domain protein [Mycobacterium xenopi 4042]